MACERGPAELGLAVVATEPLAGKASAASNEGCIEVVALNGRRVIVESDVDVDALLRIMRGLETLR